MKATFLLLPLLCLLPLSPVFGQTAPVTDLSEFTVRQIRLTPLDLMDSVIKHRPQNYPAYMYYAGRMDASITASGGGDTLFYAGRPVWLERAEYGVYSVYGRAEDKGRQQVNRATEAQTDRVINIRIYPAVHGLGAVLATLRDQVRKHDAFYGTSIRDSQRILHIIVPVDASPGNWITRKVASQFSTDTVIAYLSLEIGQADWSLRRQEWMSLSTDSATAKRFREARRYTVLNGLLQEVRQLKGARFIRNAHSFATLPGGKGYRPAVNEFEDNLYNLSNQMPKRGENGEASLFRMRVVIDKPIMELPNEDLEEATSGDFVGSEGKGMATGL